MAMDVRILPSSFVDKGNALKILYHISGKVDIEPVYYEDSRFKLIALTHSIAALIEVKSNGTATLDEMLDHRPIAMIPIQVFNGIQQYDRRDDHEVELYARARSLNMFEYNKGIIGVFYTWILDGAYDEQVHRHKQRRMH